jgi:hypothetical protein
MDASLAGRESAREGIWGGRMDGWISRLQIASKKKEAAVD